MLTIRDAQIDALSAVARGAFERRLCEELAGLHPQLPAEWLAQEVSAGVGQALDLGFEQAPDVRAFVALRLDYGPLLDRALEDPEARRAVQDPARPAASRLALLPGLALRPPPAG